jgi:hypothetical protein
MSLMHPDKIAKIHGMTQITRARHIAKTIGIHTAARYLCNRDWSLESALWILLGK